MASRLPEMRSANMKWRAETLARLKMVDAANARLAELFGR
jgi:hypothetical protein